MDDAAPMQSKLTTFIAVALVSCDTPSDAPFIVVPLTGQLGDMLPSPRELTIEERGQCRDGWSGAEATGRSVVKPPWDFVHYDGIATDDTLALLFGLSTDLQGTDPCTFSETSGLVATQPRPLPLLCDPANSMDGLLPPEDRALLCASSWQDCFYAFNGAKPGFFYASDGRLIPPLSDADRSACSCSSRAAAPRSEAILAAYDRAALAIDMERFVDVYEGDASITVVNDAPRWQPGAPDPDHNSGVCGVWVYGHADYLALTKLEENSASGSENSSLQQLCGAQLIPDECSPDEAGCPGPQPLTAIRAPLFIAGTSADYLLGGTGDLTSAYVLSNTDSPQRTCAACPATANQPCRVNSGAVTLRFGPDFRYRAAQQEGPVHVLVAECAPVEDYANSGWKRACWHTELPSAALAPGSHVRIPVRGIGPTVPRDVTDWQQQQK